MTTTEIKATVRFRDGMRCTECGMTNEEHLVRFGRQLDVHRTTPGSKYTVAGCVTVCRSCHGTKPKLPRGARKARAVAERGAVDLNVWLPPELMAAFEALRADTRRTKTAEIVVMMETYLKSLGRWPRKDKE